MRFREISPESPIQEKIAWAEACQRTLGPRLLKDGDLVRLLGQVEEAIHLSQRQLAESGVANACRRCELMEGGSCCGAGLENRYDGVLLLINRLLGVKLPKEERDPESCLFLGDEGCLLLARHVICVNYLCKEIGQRVDPEKIGDLRAIEGLQLEHLFHLQERIRAILRGEG